MIEPTILVIILVAETLVFALWIYKMQTKINDLKKQNEKGEEKINDLKKQNEKRERKIEDLSATVETLLRPAEKILADDPPSKNLLAEIRENLPTKGANHE